MLKRILKILFIVILVFFLGRQANWYIKFGGNVVIYITNQPIKETVDVQLFLDDEKLIDEYIPNEFVHSYRRAVSTSFGNHTLRIQSNEN